MAHTILLVVSLLGLTSSLKAAAGSLEEVMAAANKGESSFWVAPEAGADVVLEVMANIQRAMHQA